MHKVIALLSIGLMVFAGCAFAPTGGPEHIFLIQSAPAFLTEELAVSKARETLVQEGYNPGEWQLVPVANVEYHPPDHPYIPHKAQDGTTNKYFDSFYPWRSDAGRVYFKNGKRLRTYDVRLHGNRVICSEFRGM